MLGSKKQHAGITEDGTSTTLTSQEKERPIVSVGGLFSETATRNPVLCLLQKAYGTEAVVKWGTAIMATLQQADILRPGVHESSVSEQTKSREKLVYAPQICEAEQAERILRNLREYEEYRHTSQGRESKKQFDRKSSMPMQELPHFSPQTAKELFNMWESGEGIGILQQTLHQIQEIRESVMGERERGGEAMQSVVRRLTPLE